MSFAERVAKKLEKFGEQFTIGTSTYHGVFKVLDSGTMRNYLDDVEVMSVGRPGLLLVTEADAVIDANQTITRDGRTFTVMKVSRHRIGGECAVTIAILG